MSEVIPEFSQNANNMRKSVIRELLKLTQQPNIISFAGGLPAPETFPVHDLEEATQQVYKKSAVAALQYGATEGENPLKAELIKYERSRGIQVEKGNLLITSASQQALDMMPKIF
ncbi:MAG TPA: hypothetical protein PLT87_09215, partial [Spirochaetales bacterium]|nr:hypothetical protein [Spirochaetales bacterium]